MCECILLPTKWGNNLKHPFQQHFCCRFLHLNFALVFTENNVLSENTLNTSKEVVYFENLRILFGCNRSVLIMICEFSCKKQTNKKNPSIVSIYVPVKTAKTTFG